jgi:hypothetical protein
LEARRQYNAYCDLLRSELGVEPSAEFTALLCGAVPVPEQDRGDRLPHTTSH